MMQHRHFKEDSNCSLAGIDSFIERGKIHNWLELRDKIATNPEIAEKIIHVCAARLKNKDDEDSARHLRCFWYHYAQSRLWEKPEAERIDALWHVIYKAICQSSF
jgi:hypothetical protein